MIERTWERELGRENLRELTGEKELERKFERESSLNVVPTFSTRKRA